MERKQDENEFNAYEALKNDTSNAGLVGLDDSEYQRNVVQNNLKRAIGSKKNLQIVEVAKAINGLNSEQRCDAINGFTQTSELPKSELLERMMHSLMKNDVNALNTALKTGKHEILVDVICPKTNAEIRQLCKQYEIQNTRKLSTDIGNDISIDSNLRGILVRLVTFQRVEEDPNVVADKTEELGKEGVIVRSLMSKDKAADICKIVSMSSWPRLVKLYEIVSRDHLNHAFETIDGAAARVLGDKNGATYAVRTLIHVAHSRPYFFNNSMRLSMAGAGTRTDDLYRVLISRSEIDLRASMIVFNNDIEKNNGKTITEWFHGESAITKDLPLIGVLCGLDHIFTKNTLPFYERILNEKNKKADSQRWDQTVDEKITKLKFRKIADTSHSNDISQILSQMPQGASKCTKEQKAELKKLFSRILPVRSYSQRQELMSEYEKEYLTLGFKDNHGRTGSLFGRTPRDGDNAPKTLLATHIEMLLTDTTGRKLLLGLCMSGAEYATQQLQDAMSSKDLEWFHIVLCLLPKSEYNEILKLYPRFNKKNIGLADLITANWSSTHSSLVLDILRGERTPNSAQIDYDQVADDVKVLRCILLSKELDGLCKENPKNELERERGKKMRSQYETIVCKHYQLDKPKKEGKLDKVVIGYLLTHRSYKHICLVNNAFNYLSLSNTFHELVPKVLGSSSATSLMQIIIGIAIDEKDFICRQWVSLLKRKKLSELGYLFIHRSEIDFDLIRSEFEYKSFANGITLKGWLEKNLHLNHASLTRILQSICDAFQIEGVLTDDNSSNEQDTKTNEDEAKTSGSGSKDDNTSTSNGTGNDNENGAGSDSVPAQLKQQKSIVDVLLDGPAKGDNNDADDDGGDFRPDKDYDSDENKNKEKEDDSDTNFGNEQIEALKELFDQDMSMFLQFHKFVQSFSGNEKPNVQKRKKLSNMFGSAMSKMVAKKKSSNLDRRMAVTVCIVILLHEFSKFDASVKEYGAKAKTKEVRTAWVKQFMYFNADNDGNERASSIDFQSFFTSFWNFLPEWPKPEPAQN